MAAESPVQFQDSEHRALPARVSVLGPQAVALWKAERDQMAQALAVNRPAGCPGSVPYW